MAKGWYGLNVGDKVEYPLINGGICGTIINLSKLNKNLGTMKTESGEKFEVICERCIVIHHQ